MVCAVASLMAQDQPLFQNEAFTLYQRKVEQSAHHAQAIADNAITSTFEHREWLQHRAGGDYPTFNSSVPISNTIYNLSVEELNNLIDKDSTWKCSPDISGVQTREMSYGALLAAGYMNARVTRNSLMKRVNCWRVMQDNGTGGSWPVATDRVVWILAAWQHYLVTGDKDWLRQCYDIVRGTLLQDEAAVYDNETGLVRGESSFLNWREESYPRWMEPADIAMSECLSTNALYFRANQIAARMANILGDRTSAPIYDQRAYTIKTAINNYLWLEDKGYYGQYRYGREYPIVSTKSETLGEALCIVFGIADQDRARRIVKSVTLTPYGTPCFSPQIPNVYPYHNNAVWPFVEAFWMWASAQAGNQQAVVHSIASLYRSAALFATNQANIVAETGELSTAANTANALWSVAGNISVAHHVLMGISHEEQGLAVRPFVPKDWAGTQRLNMRYRKAQLEILVEGYGDVISAFYIDNKRQKEFFVPSSISGKHRVRVVMADQFRHQDAAKFGLVVTSPETVPEVYLDSRTTLAWRQVPGVSEYKILCNGKEVARCPERFVDGNRLTIPKAEEYSEYQVIAIDANGNESFASHPLPCYDKDNETWVDMSKFAEPTHSPECHGYSGGGAIEVAAGVNNKITFTVDVKQAGLYRIDFRYANGSDNLISSNRCAVRTLWLKGSQNEQFLGSVVMPQRGKDIWDEWGMSNGIHVILPSGKQTLMLTLGPENENMSEQGINRAMIDAARIVRVK